MNRPSQPLRLLLALALVLAAGALAWTLLSAADAALALWQRLQDLPRWMSWLYLGLLGGLGLGAGWAVWRLLHPRGARMPKAARIDRDALERRIAGLDTTLPAATQAREELQTLDRRRAEGVVQLALFGEISAGKSSLLRALVPEAPVEIGVVGGSTREVRRHRGRLADGATIEVADVPGLHESGGAAAAALARAEAARSHAVACVVDGDITRAQHQAVQALSGFGRPLLILLNKVDRYAPDEREALLSSLRQRHAGIGARVIAVQAAHRAAIAREWPDGRRETIEREVAADLGELPAVLRMLARSGADALEPGREAALLAHVDAALAEAERESRAERSAAAVEKYTRRAIVGALAAIAPGTDLVIQGALATGLLRELCAIHALQVRDVDLDDFLARAGGLVRTSTSITLAIAGNALKAFPGLGTLGGGLLHAVAYGLIFDSLGRAVTQSLARTAALDRDATLDAFRADLQAPAAERLATLAGVALEAWRARAPAADDDAVASPPQRTRSR
jgi:GTP-binding protein EngB required for normal cell division